MKFLALFIGLAAAVSITRIAVQFYRNNPKSFAFLQEREDVNNHLRGDA